MLKKIGIFLLISFFSGNLLFASIAYRLEDFDTTGSKFSLGTVKFQDRTYFKASLRPDLQLGPIGLGLDLNYYAPFGSDKTIPSELPWFNFRMLSFDYDNLAGFKWGRLTNIEYGTGLLMDQYDSGSAGSEEFNSAKAALEVYFEPKNYGVRVLNTATNLVAARAYYAFSDNVFFGKPLIIGLNYVKDRDGVFDFNQPSVNIRAAQEGYSMDLTVPLCDKILRVYTEYARLTNHGDGASVGIGGAPIPEFSYKVEYRSIGKDFVPGYFNSTYEATTFNFATQAPASSINGYLGYVGLSLLDGYVKSGIMYESYDQMKPVLSAALGWRKIGSTIGVLNFIKSFQYPAGGRFNLDLIYENCPLIPLPMDATISMQRDYSTLRDLGDKSTYTETFTISARLNLAELFPYLPLL